jgi:hypothetical protein
VVDDKRKGGFGRRNPQMLEITRGRKRHLVEEVLDSERTPEEVCSDTPDLVAAVRKRGTRLDNQPRVGRRTRSCDCVAIPPANLARVPSPVWPWSGRPPVTRQDTCSQFQYMWQRESATFQELQGAG